MDCVLRSDTVFVGSGAGDSYLLDAPRASRLFASVVKSSSLGEFYHNDGVRTCVRVHACASEEKGLPPRL